MKRLFIIIFLTTLLPKLSFSACSWSGNSGTVASPYDHVDVQACIDDASGKTGDVVISIPSASVDWDARVIINIGTGWTNVTDLTIQGAGVASTTINDTGTDTTYHTARLFHITTKAGKTFRLTGITFTNAGVTGPESQSGAIYIDGDGTSVRIDNLNFPDLKRGSSSNDFTAISVHSEQGLIDNCTFTVPSTSTTWGGNAIKFYGDGAGGVDNSWTGETFAPGTASAWYVEDCTFTFWKRGNDSWDAYGGARIVTRYCTIHGTTIGGHGNDSGNYAATHTQEIYENSFDQVCGGDTCNGGTSIVQAFQFRGGTGVFYNNTIGAGYTNAGNVVNYRSNYYHEGTASNASPSSTVLSDSGQDFTSGEGTSNGEYIYNQTDGSYCQITGSDTTSVTCSGGLSGGSDNQWKSGDKYMHFYFFNDDRGCDGNGPNDGNVVGQEGWPCKQQVGTTYEGGAYTYKPIYAWGNTLNGAPAAGGLVTSSGSSRQSTYHVVANQTYFNCDSAADCKSDADLIDVPGYGTGSGWLYPGQYTYPHPLRNEALTAISYGVGGAGISKH